jgi:hypothetical protein
MVKIDQIALLEHKIKKLEEDLEAAAKYIEENEVIHKRNKNGITTVIEYQGRRYIYDHKGVIK